jgi:radical SAM protein with 4Fe4S-binding SPASM domain
MFDIRFFKNSNPIKKKVLQQSPPLNREELYAAFEKLRRRNPCVFNIETTNACNMTCIMCPRTSLMKRRIQHMDMALFEKILKQIPVHKKNDLEKFYRFIRKEYSVFPEDRNENTFYFYTVAKSLTMHGFGEPVLDPYISERVALCQKYNIPTYFSCVPANIDVAKITAMMKAGLGTIKFSIDALDDQTQRKIRGERSNFTNSYKKICELIDFKVKEKSVKTQIVVTMIALSNKKEDLRVYRDFMALWRNKEVFAYVKSQDNRWFHEDDTGLESKSHYAAQYCEFPWLSLTIMVDGTVVPCSQDYNCEMKLGDARRQSLKEIWNSRLYAKFRKWHIYGTFPRSFKCVNRCDIKTLYKRMRQGHG